MTADNPTSGLEALRCLLSDADKRASIVQGIRRALPDEAGRDYILDLANTLQEWASALKAAASPPAKRGRPKNAGLEKDRMDQALEFYDLRISGVRTREAIQIVLGERQDGSMFAHAKRPWRSSNSFMRDMRARRTQVSGLLDLLTVTPEQLTALRQELDNKSKPKSARTRK